MSQPNAITSESVEQGHQTAVPVGSVQVDPVDAVPGEVLGATFGRALDSLEACGLQQPNRCVAEQLAQFDHPIQAGFAQPGALEHRGVDVRDHVDDRSGGLGILQVERQRVAGATRLQQLDQGRDVLGEVSSSELGNRSFAQALLDDAVVIEHCDAVGGEPDIALEPGRSEAQRQLERLQGVLGSVSAGAPMGERDRGIEQGRETLLHSVS